VMVKPIAQKRQTKRHTSNGSRASPFPTLGAAFLRKEGRNCGDCGGKQAAVGVLYGKALVRKI